MQAPPISTAKVPMSACAAMRLEIPRLKAEIDRGMDDMLVDGTMLHLIQQYIQSAVTGFLPTARPTLPAPTALPLLSTAIPPVCWGNEVCHECNLPRQ